MQRIGKDHVDLNEADFNQQTVLFYCCNFNDRVRLLELLIDNGADVNFVDRFGQTALYYACKHGNEKAVACLIKHGADVNIKDNAGTTALNFALRKGQDICAQVG